jgi:hypothetical protein
VVAAGASKRLGAELFDAIERLGAAE